MDIRDINQAAYFTYLGNGTTKMIYSGMQVIYIGYAEAGTLVTSAKWQIRKLTYNSDGLVTDIQFASGTALFDKVWNSYAGYTYS